MAEWIKRGGALPNIPEMVGELTTPEYTFKDGKFILQKKEQIKKKLGRSPDYADGLALTFAIPDMPAQMLPTDPLHHLMAESTKMQSEWDPFDPARS